MVERMSNHSIEDPCTCEVTLVDAARVERARRRLPGEDSLRAQAERFRLLGEPSRLRILHALAAEELCVCDLAALLDTSPSAVSHQLRLLRAARLVRCRRAGKMAYYSLDQPRLRELLGEGEEQ